MTFSFSEESALHCCNSKSDARIFKLVHSIGFKACGTGFLKQVNDYAAKDIICKNIL
jgi:hypothetical protein